MTRLRGAGGIRLGRALAALGLVALAACGRESPPPLSKADEAAVLAVDSAFAAALNAGDLEGILRVYAKDAWLMPPNAIPVRGIEGIRGFWGGFLRSYEVRLTFAADRYEGRGDLAYVAGHYHMETRPKAAEVPVLPPEDGKFLEVLKRATDGRWSYFVDMYNANGTGR